MLQSSYVNFMIILTCDDASDTSQNVLILLAMYHSLLTVVLIIGSASIPTAGMSTIVVLEATSLPLHDIGLLLALDWFL